MINGGKYTVITDKKLTGRITVKKFTAAVDDSMFVIPKNYGKMNLQWLSSIPSF